MKFLSSRASVIGSCLKCFLTGFALISINTELSVYLFVVVNCGVPGVPGYTLLVTDHLHVGIV